MTDKADHIAWATEAVAIFQEHCRTGDEHAIADLICDLGHLAEERGLDFRLDQSGTADLFAKSTATTAQRLTKGPTSVTPPIVNCGAARRCRCGRLPASFSIPWARNARDGWWRETGAPLQLITPNLPDATTQEAEHKRSQNCENHYQRYRHRIHPSGEAASLPRKRLPNPFSWDWLALSYVSR
jgi:hypothetical protein